MSHSELWSWPTDVASLPKGERVAASGVRLRLRDTIGATKESNMHSHTM